MLNEKVFSTQGMYTLYLYDDIGRNQSDRCGMNKTNRSEKSPTYQAKLPICGLFHRLRMCYGRRSHQKIMKKWWSDPLKTKNTPIATRYFYNLVRFLTEAVTKEILIWSGIAIVSAWASIASSISWSLPSPPYPVGFLLAWLFIGLDKTCPYRWVVTLINRDE